MQSLTPAKAEGCASCGSCSCSGAARAAESAAGDLAGWRYAARAAAIFLLPVLLAAGGSVLCAGQALRQVAGALLGVAAGAVIARALCLGRAAVSRPHLGDG